MSVFFGLHSLCLSDQGLFQFDKPCIGLLSFCRFSAESFILRTAFRVEKGDLGRATIGVHVFSLITPIRLSIIVRHRFPIFCFRIDDFQHPIYARVAERTQCDKASLANSAFGSSIQCGQRCAASFAAFAESIKAIEYARRIQRISK